MPDVKHIDKAGWATLRRVREGTMPNLYGRGIIIGPPDLSSLPYAKDALKRLVEILVDKRLVNASLIKGSAGAVYHAVRSADVDEDTKAVIRQIKSIYQKDVGGKF